MSTVLETGIISERLWLREFQGFGVLVIPHTFPTPRVQNAEKNAEKNGPTETENLDN
jgi:hypothetical protein